MKNIILRSIEPVEDFQEMAALFTSEQDEPASKESLMLDYQRHQDRIFSLTAAVNEQGEFMGFNWAVKSRFDAAEAYFYVIVRPAQRRKGAGSRLYDDLLQAAMKTGLKKLEVTIRDDNHEFWEFADRRGFRELSHSMAMSLDLERFDDLPFNEVIARLRTEGFVFTSMGALGNTEEAQRRLYALNEMTGMEAPGNEGIRSWLSFDDFQKNVCHADWYKPDGQMVVIDTGSDTWVAMSAITRFEGADYAYNLHTGVDKRYRGRKLGQAVKVMALRYARDILGVKTVRTHHNVLNLPMIAIDRKFGYVQITGNYRMVKDL